MKDIAGHPIEVGDYVTSPTKVADITVLQFGRVTSVSKGLWVLSVKPEINYTRDVEVNKRAMKRQYPERMLVVHPTMVPAKVWMALHQATKEDDDE